MENVSESHPLLPALQERIILWQQDIGVETCPRLPLLQEALTYAAEGSVEPEVFILIVAICEFWFRVYSASPPEVETELRHRLMTPLELRRGPERKRTLVGVRPPVAVQSYVDWRLRALTDNPERKLSQLQRFSLQPRIKELAAEYAGPFLVAENRPLSTRRGGYRQWGPWVAAAAIYHGVRERYPERHDSRALQAASTLLEALRGERADKSLFHRNRHTIAVYAPRLIETLWTDFRTALLGYGKQRSERLRYLLSAGRFDSLAECGGLHLLTMRQWTK